MQVVAVVVVTVELAALVERVEVALVVLETVTA